MSTDGNLLTLGVGGKTWAREMPYLFGAIVVDVEQPYFVNRDPIFSEMGLVYTVGGRLSVDYAMPYTLVGAASGEVEMRYHLLSGADSVFDEGGLAAPIIGFFDEQDIV